MTTCIHLKTLYDLCQANDIRLASHDLVHVVCMQCGKKEVCPSMLLEEYEWDHGETEAVAETAPVAPR